jgi:serine/threonine protein kinase
MMSVDSTASLIEALRESRILESPQLDELARTLQHQYSDPRALARVLIERDWLTPYQVNQLLQGAGRDLRLGQYILVQRLNETALGQAYKARHQHMRRLAVLTIVREKLLAQPGAVERFYQEIQAVSRLNHPNLACAFDAGPIGRSHFFALEFVEGLDLEQLIRQSGALSVPLAARLVRQVAAGLQHAHERGLLHHDLRPANVLVTRLGPRSDDAGRDQTPRPTTEPFEEAQVKVCDLGLTLLLPRPRGDDALDGVKQADASDFCPPEQEPGLPLNDIRSNLYSLGCIFYYLVSGHVPFPGDDSSVKREQHRTAEPEPLNWQVPSDVGAIIMRLMAKDPADRFQTPAQLVAALTPYCRESDRNADRPSPGASKKSFLQQAWLLWTSAGLLLALVLFAIANFTSRSDPEQAETGAKDAPPPGVAYVKGRTLEETILATLKANHLPTLEDHWFYIGPFDNANKKGFNTAYPPEKGVDLNQKYPGKGGHEIGWKDFGQFRPGRNVNLKLYKNNDWVCTYLYHAFDSAEAGSLPVSFGSDDTLTVWFNEEKLVAQDTYRGCAADQARANLNLRAGKNELLLKICNGTGDYAVYVNPLWPSAVQQAFGRNLERDFPPKK